MRVFKKTVCILVSGKAGVGKSTFCKFLGLAANRCNFKFHQSSFSWGVKNIAKYMGWNEVKDEKGRKLLQDIGRVGREFDEYIWAKSSMRRLELELGYPFSIVAFDDWRFPNELEYINKFEPLYKTYTVRIESPKRETLVGMPLYNDVSETSLPPISGNFKYDFEIFNNSDTTEDLKDIAYSLVLSFINSEEYTYNVEPY